MYVVGLGRLDPSFLQGRNRCVKSPEYCCVEGTAGEYLQPVSVSQRIAVSLGIFIVINSDTKIPAAISSTSLQVIRFEFVARRFTTGRSPAGCLIGIEGSPSPYTLSQQQEGAHLNFLPPSLQIGTFLLYMYTN